PRRHAAEVQNSPRKDRQSGGWSEQAQCEFSPVRQPQMGTGGEQEHEDREWKDPGQGWIPVHDLYLIRVTPRCGG
ncbi:MAG TPA: hypothetical protein PKJ41_04905, partial [Bryobacteraceae bacterium]|nr:hypothetical protein [Bryobacteraceae bacterium]